MLRGDSAHGAKLSFRHVGLPGQMPLDCCCNLRGVVVFTPKRAQRAALVHGCNRCGGLCRFGVPVEGFANLTPANPQTVVEVVLDLPGITDPGSLRIVDYGLFLVIVHVCASVA